MPGANDKDNPDSKAPSPGAGPAGERHRDEQRQGGGPRYGGQDWKVADERGDNRFGHARNDDSDPSELDRGTAEDDDAPSADPDLAAAEEGAEIESGNGQEGMGRVRRPRKEQ